MWRTNNSDFKTNSIQTIEKGTFRKPLANITNSTRNTPSCKKERTLQPFPAQQTSCVEFQPEIDDDFIGDEPMFYPTGRFFSNE